jgi:type II secretory pathway pseudopilin PulG
MANFLGVMSTLWALLKAIPEALAILKSITAWVHEFKEAMAKKEAMSQLRKAIDQAKTGDTSGLDKLFNGAVQNEKKPGNN